MEALRSSSGHRQVEKIKAGVSNSCHLGLISLKLASSVISLFLMTVCSSIGLSGSALCVFSPHSFCPRNGICTDVSHSLNERNPCSVSKFTVIK